MNRKETIILKQEIARFVKEAIETSFSTGNYQEIIVEEDKFSLAKKKFFKPQEQRKE